VPLLHWNVTDEDVRVEFGGGLVIAGVVPEVLTVPLTGIDLFKLLLFASAIVRFPLTFAVADALIRA
jgi:hypothetical protein